ncbi:MAG: tetratricopeptide repeat protein [bacterium]
MNPETIKKIINVCLYSILITPFLVWGKFVFPYITPKTMFFRIAIEIALFFYILLIIYKPEYRPKFSKLTWAVLIYILIITFTSIFGLNLYRSFWGNIERGEGLLTIYHLFVFFIIITALFKDKKEWFRFFTVSIFVSLLVSFYALGQKLGVSLLLPSSGGTRLSGTIGNPSFLAAYLLMSAFLCLFLLVNKKEWAWQIFFGLTFLFETYIIFQTETRGAILGFFGGLLLLAVLAVIFSKNKKLRIGFVGLFLILIIFASTVWFCKDQEWVVNNGAFYRLTTISFDSVTVQSRILGWQAALKGWKDRFFLGYGYENYNIAYNKYFPSLVFQDVGSRVWFDRAHNIILDQAVPGGIFGLLSYLSILGFAFWISWSFLWKSWKKTSSNQENKPFFSLKNDYTQIGFIVLIVLLAGYFIQNLFVFDTLGTYILFYSILGFLAYLSTSNHLDEQANNQDENIQNQIKTNTQPRTFLIIVLVLFFVCGLYVFNLKPSWANAVSVDAMKYSYYDMYRESMIEFRKALSYNTNQSPEIRHTLISTVIGAYQSGKLTQKENIDNFDFAIKETEKNLQEFPWNARHYVFAMTLYNAAAKLNPIYYDKVIDLGEQALILSPTRPQLYYSIGQAKASQGKYEEAIQDFKKAVELNPEVIESHWNLAAVYIINRQDELAEQEFAQMREMGLDYYSVDNLKRLVNPYLNRGDFNKLAWLYEEMIKIEPNNPDFYAKLAACYKEIGEIDKARQAVKKAVELDPDFAGEAEIFLKLLDEME